MSVIPTDAHCDGVCLSNEGLVSELIQDGLTRSLNKSKSSDNYTAFAFVVDSLDGTTSTLSSTGEELSHPKLSATKSRSLRDYIMKLTINGPVNLSLDLHHHPLISICDESLLGISGVPTCELFPSLCSSLNLEHTGPFEWMVILIYITILKKSGSTNVPELVELLYHDLIVHSSLTDLILLL